MNTIPEVRPEFYLGRKTLILGDVNTGKTTLTQQILEALCGKGLEGRIAIVDMAPEIPAHLATQRGIPRVGGKLSPPEGKDILYLSSRFEPPRLSSITDDEAQEKAWINLQIIEQLFKQLALLLRDILLVNDISMYLQAGTADALIPWLDGADTVIANGYWGKRLGKGRLTEREKVEMVKLKSYFEKKGCVLMR